MTAIDQPIQKSERYILMDLLRGLAVMMIFAVNIKMMFNPHQFYMNPTLWDGSYDLLIGKLQMIFIDNKFRSIFSILFGAGMIMIAEKSESTGVNRNMRRQLFLLLFGFIHLVFIWAGDILFTYAICGFAMLFMWQRSAKFMLWGAILATIFGGGFIWLSAAMVYIPMEEIKEAMAESMMKGDGASALAEIAAYQGTIFQHIIQRLIGGLGFALMFLLSGGFIITVGLMMMGAYLFKTNFFKLEWSTGGYFGFALLLPLVWGVEYAQIAYIDSTNWAMEPFIFLSSSGMFKGFLGALGYMGLFGLLVKMGLRFPPLSAAGRMAFTNYIACSLIGTTIAYGHMTGVYVFGYELGRYNDVTMLELMQIVGVTLVAMLIWSPLWLAIFRYGPLEWLWRSMTYGKLQPILK